MQDRYDLTKGNIFKQIILVSLPVMATSLVQMAYNLTDLFWLGRISDDAVAAAGFGGFFIWLGNAVILLARIGTEVRVSQQIGQENEAEAKAFALTGIQMELILSFIYALLLILFTPTWISFFQIKDAHVHQEAITYLRLVSFGMVFFAINPVLSAALNGTGNTFWPFVISSLGLVINMILDPIFIFVLDLNVAGAAIATALAQVIVTIIFIIYFKVRNSILSGIKLLSRINWSRVKNILRLGVPSALQSALFTFISMIITRIVVSVAVDSGANAAQEIGQQIESLSWLVAGGFSTALGAFVGQNFGAKKYDRVLKGVRVSFIAMAVYGILVTGLLYFAAEPLFTVFIQDEPDTILIGIDYLKILAFSQVFMIIEAVFGGALNGLGTTVPQSVVSITFNILRIPMAYFLSFNLGYGLNGIWTALTISSILKGIVITIWFKLYITKKGYRVSASEIQLETI